MIGEKLKTGKLIFRNRLVYPPVFTGKASKEGKVTEETLKYYDAQTKDRVFSMVTIEHTFVDQRGKASEKQISAATDEMTEGLSKLAAVIKSNDTMAVLQLNHAGSCSESSVTGAPLLAPSAVDNPRKGEMPKEMTCEDIAALTEAFRQAARRGKEAGFDGVEIHSAHSYCLNQFYSPLTNKRTDNYGGGIENRLRIHREIAEAVREQVGAEYPVFMRLGACDHMEGGNGIDEAVTAAVMMEKAGIDLLDVSGGMCGYVNPANSGPGYFATESKAVKEAVNIPVIITGGVKNLREADDLLGEGAGNLIGIARAAFNNPKWLGEAKAYLGNI